MSERWVLLATRVWQLQPSFVGRVARTFANRLSEPLFLTIMPPLSVENVPQLPCQAACDPQWYRRLCISMAFTPKVQLE